MSKERRKEEKTPAIHRYFYDKITKIEFPLEPDY